MPRFCMAAKSWRYDLASSSTRCPSVLCGRRRSSNQLIEGSVAPLKCKIYIYTSNKNVLLDWNILRCQHTSSGKISSEMQMASWADPALEAVPLVQAPVVGRVLQAPELELLLQDGSHRYSAAPPPPTPKTKPRYSSGPRNGKDRETNACHSVATSQLGERQPLVGMPAELCRPETHRRRGTLAPLQTAGRGEHCRAWSIGKHVLCPKSNIYYWDVVENKKKHFGEQCVLESTVAKAVHQAKYFFHDFTTTLLSNFTISQNANSTITTITTTTTGRPALHFILL